MAATEKFAKAGDMAGTIDMPGTEFNRRLEELALKLERTSILLVDAMVDPNETISLEQSAYNDLVICMAKYGEFLNSLNETTVDATDEIREIVGKEDCCYGETDTENDADLPDDVTEEDEDYESGL
jgi:hypothetical protein